MVIHIFFVIKKIATLPSFCCFTFTREKRKKKCWAFASISFGFPPPPLSLCACTNKYEEDGPTHHPINTLSSSSLSLRPPYIFIFYPPIFGNDGKKVEGGGEINQMEHKKKKKVFCYIGYVILCCCFGCTYGRSGCWTWRRTSIRFLLVPFLFDLILFIIFFFYCYLCFDVILDLLMMDLFLWWRNTGADEAVRFQGNTTSKDHFRLLQSDGEFVLVGARLIDDFLELIAFYFWFLFGNVAQLSFAFFKKEKRYSKF